MIYIAGWGRSGSTVIGSLLGQYDRTAYIGELNNLWEDVFIRDEHCGCGKRHSDCGFWLGVLSGCDIGPAEGRHMVDLNYQNLSTRSILLSRAKLRRSLAHGPMASYREASGKVLREAARRLQADILIDGSKTPNLLEFYAQLRDVDVKILHLIRDPRAVAYSWRHRAKPRGFSTQSELMERHNPVRSTAAWLARNHLIEVGARQLGLAYQRLRYEDFAAAPTQSISAILEGFGLTPASADRHAGNPHSIRGNPVRFAREPITIRPDETWKTKMPQTERWLVSAMASPQLLRYNYAMSV